MNAIAKQITGLITSFEAHLPASVRDLIELEITTFLLSKIDLKKFVGTLSPTLFITLSAAVDARNNK